MRGDVAQAFGLASLTQHDDGRERRGAAIPIVDLVEDLSWQHDAACHPRHKPETMTLGTWVNQWFPHPTESPDAALAICADCPVRDQCLDAHLFEQAGIWGGTTGRQRSRLRKQRGLPQRTKQRIDHGTQGGYRAHLRRGEDPCPPCRHAHADAQVVRKARERRAEQLRDGAA